MVGWLADRLMVAGLSPINSRNLIIVGRCSPSLQPKHQATWWRCERHQNLHFRHALTRRINSAQRSRTGNVFSAGSSDNVVTTREIPISRYRFNRSVSRRSRSPTRPGADLPPAGVGLPPTVLGPVSPVRDAHTGAHGCDREERIPISKAELSS